MIEGYKAIENESAEGIVFMQNTNTGNNLVYKRTDVESGLNEVSAYKMLPNSPLIEFKIEDGAMTIILQRHSGRSLAEWVSEKSGRVRLAKNMDSLLHSIQVEIEKIHGAGIYHGAITPSSIVIADDFSVKFVGLSNARLIDKPFTKWSMSPYIAPEVVFGYSRDAKKIDYYSIGICLSKLILGVEDLVGYDSITKITNLCSLIPDKRSFSL